MSGEIMSNKVRVSCSDYAVSSNYATINDYTIADLIDSCTVTNKKEPEVRTDTKTELKVSNNKIYARHYSDGFFQTEKYLIPAITDVKVYNNTVVVFFADNTKTSAVLNREDKFNLEQGISICLTKKLLGENGNSLCLFILGGKHTKSVLYYYYLHLNKKLKKFKLKPENLLELSHGDFLKKKKD